MAASAAADERFPIAELARRSGFSRPTLRYYEKLGLLEPPERSEVGHRLYDHEAEARLEFIRRAKQIGLSLDEIRDLVAFWAKGECGTTRARLRQLVSAKITSVREQIEESSTFLRQLDLVAQRLDAPPEEQSDAGCGCAPELPHVDRVQLGRELALVSSGSCTCGGSCAGGGCTCGCACCEQTA